MITELHELFSELPRYRFPLSAENKKEIPANGIYIFFEEGEKWGNFDRIVKVGTHEAKDRLFGRLQEHFSSNMNGSSFRKYLGETLLAVNPSFEANIEEEITRYLTEKMSFCVFEVNTKEEREFWERKIASTLAQSIDFRNAISANWFGKNSPRLEIKTYGLWQTSKKELTQESLTPQEFEELKNLI